MRRWPTLYIPHGGGPCFFMEPTPPFPPGAWDHMAEYLRGIDVSLGERPRAVLVVSAHWETQHPTLGTALSPDLYFDYYGFPEHTYRLTYPAAGSAWLTARCAQLLSAAGFAPQEDALRGLDHGVFVPFKLIYPQADVPIVALSLLRSLDPRAHLALGHALEPLREEGVLIVGSGMSYHNMAGLMGNPDTDGAAAAFDSWLEQAVGVAGGGRDATLADWASAPGARAAHPREEHLVPLFVAAGAGGADRGTRVYRDRLMGKALSAFRFG